MARTEPGSGSAAPARQESGAQERWRSNAQDETVGEPDDGAGSTSRAAEDTGKESLWFLITALCVGGAERTLVDLVNGLDTDRYDVTVWTIFDETPLAADLDSTVTIRSLSDDGVVENGYVVAAGNPLTYLLAPLKFCYAAAVERPAIIQSFLLFDNVVARLAGLVSRARIITGVRCVPNDRSTLRTLLDRATIRLSDLIVSNSRAGAAYAADLGAPPERISVVHNGRDVDQFEAADSTGIEAELGIEPDELVVGTVGRLLERKGHYELVSAWAEVQDGHPNTRLLLVGDGPEREDLQAHAESAGCADSIEFLGRREDVPKLLAAMDVFVFPSHFEGLPGAVIEAMAAGLPIVATPVDGTAELLDAYETGLFVPVKEPAAIAAAISRVLETPALRSSLGERAQERAREQFGTDAMIAGFEAHYAAVLDDGPARATSSHDE